MLVMSILQEGNCTGVPPALRAANVKASTVIELRCIATSCQYLTARVEGKYRAWLE